MGRKTAAEKSHEMYVGELGKVDRRLEKARENYEARIAEDRKHREFICERLAELKAQIAAASAQEEGQG